MKKKAALLLAAVMTFSLGTTAMAAPSPAITTRSVRQVVVNPSIGGDSRTVSLSGQQTATLPGTTFVTAGGQTVDAAAVALRSAPSSVQEAQEAAASLVSAIASGDMRILNFTGQKALSLTDAAGNLNIVNHMSIGLSTASGEAVSQNGSISAAFALSDILGERTLQEGETVQALYRRADGTWAAVPVVIINGAIAIALPAFSGAVNVTFVVAQGTPSSTVSASAAVSPAT
ncbi:MAG TPA: hypothetical protein H9700_09050 [Candidatus Eisenbergiella intestinipullorum]|nr:hypothetical protein [Candidatus Eisenbergiella intestinipullorum]